MTKQHLALILLGLFVVLHPILHPLEGGMLDAYCWTLWNWAND